MANQLPDAGVAGKVGEALCACVGLPVEPRLVGAADVRAVLVDADGTAVFAVRGCTRLSAPTINRPPTTTPATVPSANLRFPMPVLPCWSMCALP